MDGVWTLYVCVHRASGADWIEIEREMVVINNESTASIKTRHYAVLQPGEIQWSFA
jgi:hypothetical protein